MRAEVGAGFEVTATRFPLVGARPPLLVGPPLRLPGVAAWRAALPWLLRQDPGDMSGGALFLDVEATGLGRAAGTVPFVVGVAALAEDAVVVEQWVLSRLSAEGAMLAAVARRLGEARAGGAPLVTFNGGSFDLPLLRARFRRYGLAEATLAGGHLDLLPVARRLWRGRGPDCRLGTLEARQLGALRLGDIPGHAIPEAFWAALRRPHDADAARRLRQVCAHNLVDVLTMPALALQMAETVAAPTDLELALRSADHLNAIGRRSAAAAMLEPWAAGLVGRGPGAAAPSAERRALLRAAELLRREGRLPAAAGLHAAASAVSPCSGRLPEPSAGAPDRASVKSS